MCTLHGPGAKERWRPKGEKYIVVDKNGKKRTTFDKEYFWVCDLTSRGGEEADPDQVECDENTIRKPG